MPLTNACFQTSKMLQTADSESRPISQYVQPQTMYFRSEQLGHPGHPHRQMSDGHTKSRLGHKSRLNSHWSDLEVSSGAAEYFDSLSAVDYMLYGYGSEIEHRIVIGQRIVLAWVPDGSLSAKGSLSNGSLSKGSSQSDATSVCRGMAGN